VNKFMIGVVLSAAVVCAPRPSAHGQEIFWDRVRSNNASMAGLQPAWVGPLIQSDPRLTQGLRISVSRAEAPGAETLSYGNNHGLALIAGRRFQFDFNPPDFFRNHCPALPDGWGNASAQVKYRIASGNADHGNYIVTAILEHGFASGAHENGALTGYDLPKLAAGKALGRFDVQSVVNGMLPMARINQQGRAIEWSVAGQFHTSSRTWFDVENNATFNFGGPNDGRTQNFMTPAAFLLLRKKTWAQRHPAAIVDGGMQIATSHFHCYNHNVVIELRVLF
jgi:hypothetical protein